MQKRKLGTAVVWMVCLLGMVAVVWSRPPLASSRNAAHPPLAMAAEDVPQLPQTIDMESHPPITEPMPELEPLPTAPQTTPALPTLVLVREVKLYKLTFKFEGNRLLATFGGVLDDEGLKAECRIAADYQLTKDSMLYGIITSAEYDVSTDNPEERLHAEQLILQFLDQPFAFRYRLDEEALTIKDFKIAPIKEPSDFTPMLMPFIMGTYRPAPALLANP